MIKYSLAAILAMAALSSFAQVRVIDSQPSMGSTPSARTQLAQNSDSGAQRGSAVSDSQLMELYYQLQSLQQEVQQLQGLVEEQGHELKRLKQQRMDDYLDLDRRISQLSGGESTAERGSDARSTRGSNGVATANGPGNRDEQADYRRAIDLVLKEQDYDAGIKALEQHLSDYPNGRYAANAQYWLGQIFMLRNDLEQSRQWFVTMLDNYPDHQKAPEAKFKLGRIYDMMGDKTQARKLLEEVAASGSSAANLAREYLRQNFSS